MAVMVGTLLEFYARQGMQDQRIALAKVAAQNSPKDISLILHEHQTKSTTSRMRRPPGGQREAFQRRKPRCWATLLSR